MGWMWQVLNTKLKVDSHWEQLAISGMQEALLAHQRGLTESVFSNLKNKGGKLVEVQLAFNEWRECNKIMADRLKRLVTELENNTAVDLSMIIVVSQNLRSLIRTSLVYDL
jgi:NAD-specific glutamate dehydrogenase